MVEMKDYIPTMELKKVAVELLQTRGVTIEEMAKIVYDLQKKYNNITFNQCIEHVDAVLNKREILHALIVGIELDQLAEKKQLSNTLQQILETDESLFGVDETMALGSVFGYGSIALTNFGYLDKVKPGIIGQLDRNENQVHTFLDDLVAAIVAATAARVAHRSRDEMEEEV